ncbi:hypothetical protein [Bradyrhizobium sp. B120]|uniref:hypothetical protein n=1 Tax=Bradyrhizobium sp. B120 TaxID=3410088 RepID=UPI003B983B62
MPAGRRYPKLPTPRGRGFAGLDDQAAVGAMQTGLEQAGNGFVQHAAFVAARAWHSAGSILTGGDPACAPIAAVRSRMQVRSRVRRSALRARQQCRGSARPARTRVGFIHPYDK